MKTIRMATLLRSVLVCEIGVWVVLSTALSAQSPARVWTSQDGRSVTATLVEVAGANVVIQLADGTRSSVPVTALSRADQEYLRTLEAGKPAADPVRPAAAGALTWPREVVAADPKSIVVTEGLQDKTRRRFHYETESFEFISTAPLAGSVMGEVAADFILTLKYFLIQPGTGHRVPRAATVSLF
jgi:hypothetical protein